MRANNRKWQPEDDLQLTELRATGMKWSVVAKKLKKTESARRWPVACVLGIPKLQRPSVRAEPAVKNLAPQCWLRICRP